MLAGQVVFYDLDHCREFLQTHSNDLKKSGQGLSSLGLYRPLFHGFTNEALETSAITLGQFDQALVYVFIPESLSRSQNPAANRVAREKAIELLGSSAPMIFEIKSARDMKPPIADHAACENWMQPELLEIINEAQLEIQMVFNGQAFYEQILAPLLAQNGFTTPDNYLTAAKSGFVQVRHGSAPTKAYKIPWIKWIREMLTGGYSMSYLMACLGTYLQKIQESMSDATPPSSTV